MIVVSQEMSSTSLEVSGSGHLAASSRFSHLNDNFCFILDKDNWFMFQRSESIACGPMFTDAIFHKLTGVRDTEEYIEDLNDNLDDDVDETVYEERQESYIGLMEAIYNALLENDRKDYQRHMDLGQGLIEDPVAVIARLGTYYLNSYPGNDDTAKDGPLHRMLWRFPFGNDTCEDVIEKALRSLEYRINQMSTTDRYLEIMELPAPDGKCCADFRMDRFERTHSSDNGYHQAYSRLSACIRGREIFFPHPTDGCHSFFKGMEYLAVAFYLAETPYAEVDGKLDALVAVMDPELEAQKRAVLRDPEVVLQRARVGEAFGVALGD